MKKVQAIIITASLFLGACGGGSSPKVKSISPEQGTMNGGTTVTITGSNFVDLVRVSIGNIECQPVTIVSEEELRCITGANPFVITDAIVDVEIRNSNGENGKLKNSFTYRAN
jgi:hypothetical protein